MAAAAWGAIEVGQFLWQTEKSCARNYSRTIFRAAGVSLSFMEVRVVASICHLASLGSITTRDTIRSHHAFLGALYDPSHVGYRRVVPNNGGK